MKDFILIDITTQASTVATIIAGWSAGQIIAWFTQQGKLERAGYARDPNLYAFTSSIGITTGLRITDDGAVYLLTPDTIRPLT